MDTLNMFGVTIHLVTMLHLLYRIYWLKKILIYAIFQLVQPANQFVISKIKNAWNHQWEAKKAQLIADGEWQNDCNGDGRRWLGKLKNPRKSFFWLLQLMLFLM